MPRESHYESRHSEFSFMAHPRSPEWRRPQLGALSAVMSHWTLDPKERLLVSMPTGSGKSGVATSLPYLMRAHRTLIVVPSTELRSQIAESFRTEDVLRRIGAVTGSLRPVVEEVKGREIDWRSLESVDVVVALPNSISPSHFGESSAPNVDFFDLVIIDEAHHTPAKTWRSILDFYSSARAVLLTATPRRSDGKSLPGTHAYHYPLRMAIADGIYQRIDPRILEPAPESTLDDRDQMIAAEVVAVSHLQEHANSAILVRAKSVLRAERLKSLYGSLGLDAQILTSTVGEGERARTIEAWRSGTLRALVTVDMLTEGFDLPSLRVVGYHDKHKSEPATMQFIGRLARSSPLHPQASVLVTARDEDVYPALQGALRNLYKEDADWAEVLPELIDEPIRARQLDLEYLGGFSEGPPPAVSLGAIAPLARAVIYEAPLESTWRPVFIDGSIPPELQAGAILATQTVVYAGLNSTSTQLVILTSILEAPRWYLDEGLTRAAFDLHVVSWHASPQTTRRDLLFMNTRNRRMASAILEVLDPTSLLRNGNPAFLQEAFDSLERISVSSIGVRNTFAATSGTPAYAMFAGSGIERGLSEADTNSRALGHAMAQVEAAEGGQSTNAGMAAAKSKYWETRYLGLRAYEAFATELAGRYWFPRPTASGPLLPNVARAIRTDAFPDSTPIHAELNPSLLGRGWTLSDGRPLESLDLEATSADSTEIAMRLFDPRTPGTSVWVGRQDIQGRFTTDHESHEASRGSGLRAGVGELFSVSPPTIYFLDSSTIYGAVTYLPTGVETWIPDAINFATWDWAGVDTRRETPRPGRTDSIHERVEIELLAARTAPGSSRWVLRNDGQGEIADHLVIEKTSTGRFKFELWHSKFAASPTPAVRVDDMQIVTQQAAKSRRHITDRDLWNRLGRRLLAEEAPVLTLLSGDRNTLLALCGRDLARQDESIAARPPSLDAKLVVVQPGLSVGALESRLPSGEVPAVQVRDFLVFLTNAVQRVAQLEVVCSP